MIREAVRERLPGAEGVRFPFSLANANMHLISDIKLYIPSMLLGIIKRSKTAGLAWTFFFSLEGRLLTCRQ